MPRYDYKCKECGEVFEVSHGIHDNVDECPRCGGEVRRVFHPVGVVFKGSGFYATDSRKDSKTPVEKEKAAEKPEKAPEKAKEDKKEGGTSSKEKKPDQPVKAGS